MSTDFEINDTEFPTGKVGHSSTKSMYDLKVKNSEVYWMEEIPVVQKYAKYNSVSKTLTFFEDEGDKYENNQVIGDETFWTDIEQNMSETTVPWHSLRSEVSHVIFSTSITPITQCKYFTGMVNLEDIQNLSMLNTSKLTNMSQIFYMYHDSSGGSTTVRTKLTSLDISSFDTSNVTSMYNMFYGCDALLTLDLNNFNTSKVQNMNGMFSGCKSLTSLNVTSFDTSKVTNMTHMFYNCQHVSRLNVSNFDTSNVTDMSNMFWFCKSLTSLDVSSFNTSNVTNMYGMFADCENIRAFDVSNFDTSEVTSMSYMFSKCTAIVALDLSNFDTLNVTNMSHMFFGCNVIDLDVTSFDTSNVTNMAGMFEYCGNLQYIDISGFDVNMVTNMNSMFHVCENLIELDLTSFNTSNVTDMTYMFSGCNNLEHIYVSPKWSVDAVTRSNSMFNTCMKLPNYNTSIVDKTNAHYNEGGYLELGQEAYVRTDGYNGTRTFFKDTIGKYQNDQILPNTHHPNYEDHIYTGIETEDWGSIGTNGLVKNTPWNTGAYGRKLGYIIKDKIKPISTYHWFYTPSSVTGLENLDTSKVTNMAYMFADNRDLSGYSTHLTSLDLSSFDTSHVTDMKYMFLNQQFISNLNVSSFDTSNVVNMKSMFDYCTWLENLDLSSFDTSNVADASDMFYGDSNLTTILVSEKWNTTKMLPNSRDMFLDATRLPNYRSNSVSAFQAHYNTGGYLTYYLWGQAYAVYNDTDKTLKFFRDVENKYTNEQVVDDNIYYTGFENMSGSSIVNRKWYDKCSEVQKVEFEDYIRPKDITSWFYNFTSLTTFITNNKLITNRITSLGNLFSNCVLLDTIDKLNFDTSNVIIMLSTFSYCRSLSEIDLSSWDTSRVVLANFLFDMPQSTALLERIYASDKWDMRSSDIDGNNCVFRRCYKLPNWGDNQNASFGIDKATFEQLGGFLTYKRHK